MTVLLFGHQDDEFALLPLIRSAIDDGERVRAVYFTANKDAAREQVRERESEIALAQLGLHSDNLVFLGERIGVPDGECHQHLSKLSSALIRILNEFRSEEVRLLLPAWEGGHHDHDVVHALGMLVARHSFSDAAVKIQQFPMYTGVFNGFWFRVMSPRKENGPVTRIRFSFLDGLRALLVTRFYRSQWRSFLGLLPGSTVRYAILRRLDLQIPNLQRVMQRPHEGTLLYERRYRVAYSTIAASIAELRDTLERSAMNLV